MTSVTRPWLASYPSGVPHDIDTQGYTSLIDLLDRALHEHADRVALSFLGADYTYASLDAFGTALAAWLQGAGLQRGDRVALMMPNIPQYAVATLAVLRAGCIIVNVNPLYTVRELEYQLNDSGAKAILVVENVAATLASCIHRTGVQHVVLASVGDMLGPLKGRLVNAVLRNIKKAVPPFDLPNAVRFKDALKLGKRSLHEPARSELQDIALLQYTGGTTGVSKGAMLLHKNLLASVIQTEAWHVPVTQRLSSDEQATFVCALPLYHIFAFASLLLTLKLGGKLVLIPNPRDIEGMLKELSRHRIHVLPAVNTLFNAMMSHRAFSTVDWSHLRAAVGGGMAVHRAVADRWKEKTGITICEGYGLTETSPIASCNPLTTTDFSGFIGVPVSSTLMACLDDNGKEVSLGEPGEIAIRGPQVMGGYWQRPDETEKVMTPDGFFRTGDIGTMDERGFFRIVERKKDMIVVSGFNVYPNEIEEVVSQLEAVVECAAVGISDSHSGEAVKLVVVPKDGGLTEQAIRQHCRLHLTAYKQPRLIEFRTELPKSPVGKILRRELRQQTADANV